MQARGKWIINHVTVFVLQASQAGYPDYTGLCNHTVNICKMGPLWNNLVISVVMKPERERCFWAKQPKGKECLNIQK